MSYAEDMGYDMYSSEEIEAWREAKRIDQDDKGRDICANCGSSNIKLSQKDNKYCADLCWVEPVEPAVRKKIPFIKHLGF